jgi:RNase H-like domain found in reverse transcriptase
MPPLHHLLLSLVIMSSLYGVLNIKKPSSTSEILLLAKSSSIILTSPFYTDASHDQIGGIISQDGYPIAFYSRKLTKSQQNYTSKMEKKQLSIVETDEQQRNILLGFECRFYSDHKNLLFVNFAL